MFFFFALFCLLDRFSDTLSLSLCNHFLFNKFKMETVVLFCSSLRKDTCFQIIIYHLLRRFNWWCDIANQGALFWSLQGFQGFGLGFCGITFWVSHQGLGKIIHHQSWKTGSECSQTIPELPTVGGFTLAEDFGTEPFFFF